MKWLLNAIGVLAVLLGILGLFLPLLPTTPFILLAAACFARGSTRLHQRLLQNRWFGQLLSDYEQGRGIPARSKALALLMLWSSLGWAIWRMQAWPLRLVLGVTGVAVSLYLLRLPTRSTPDSTNCD